MNKLIASSAAAFSLGLSLTLTQIPVASAEQTQSPQMSQQTRGTVTIDRSRGRVGGVRIGGGSRHYSRGRIGGGIAAGIATAIIINEFAAPRYGYYSSYGYYGGGYGLSCSQLEARCDAGQEWACRRLDRDPNC